MGNIFLLENQKLPHCIPLWFQSECFLGADPELGSMCCFDGSNLVDSASSHTLVSKIKPCMSKYKSFTLKLRTAHYISYSLFDSPLLLG